jgi:hypothetical protein
MEFTVFSSLSVSAVSGKFQTQGFLELNIQLYNSYFKTNLSIQDIYNDAVFLLLVSVADCHRQGATPISQLGII